MTITVGKYTFSSWLRKGIGARIIEVDNLATAISTVVERAKVPVDVMVNDQSIHKEFALLGPGDVIGINPDAVVRTEPRDWVTDFEPNYLAFIEFYDEDFIFRFTPVRASESKLRPWLALLVLEEATPESPGEFERRSNRRLPLPSITVKAAALPPHNQTWAWGHVHTNQAFPTATDFEQFLQTLATPDHPNNDRIISRLMSPRHLKPNTPYGAFLVPAFETGRRAGLEDDPSTCDAQQPSWTDATGDVELPVYYQWRFRTGENEDFEELVKRLEPRPADPRVGVRPMDGEKPGWGMVNGTELGPVLPADEKQSVVGLMGALKSPTTQPRPEMVDTSLPFFAELEPTLNLPEDLRGSAPFNDLPVISPPIYGEHHALRHTVDVTDAGWVHVLNRDPRTRTPAGFGVRAIQENQENYVARAWTQVRRILEANSAVRLLSYAMEASRAVHENFAQKLPPAEVVAYLAPLMRKVRGSETTLAHQLKGSTLPPAALCGAMRRMVRPRGAIARRIRRVYPGFTHAELITGMADGREGFSAAPPYEVPGDLSTDTELTGQLSGGSIPAWLAWLIRFRLLLLILVLVILLIVGTATGAGALVAVLAAAAVAGWWFLRQKAKAQAEVAALTDPSKLADAIARGPRRPNFHFRERDPVVRPTETAITQVSVTAVSTSTSANAVNFSEVTTFTPSSSGDSVEARNFRRAALALSRRMSVTVAATGKKTYDLDSAGQKLSAAVKPTAVFPRRAAAIVKFGFAPEWLLNPNNLVPAMAYPDFDDPMYEKLRDISSELLLPNLELIPPNTITLLETNPPFIESYIVGLNYEFGKELLWREYPTDRRGSYFRQFWDVRGIIAMPTDEDPAITAEKGRDVVPLDTWSSASALGTHRNPLRPRGEQVVLTVRGDLLKKYPNTLIYAQKAHAKRVQGLLVDPIVSDVASEDDVRNEIKFPAFKASIDPDIKFFGFDMTVEQARGAENPQADTDDWGWYFVIQQLPGEPRFGMDVTYSPDDDPNTPVTWDDLAWSHFPETMSFVSIAQPPTGISPAGAGESAAQWGSDSARMASILYQRPVMILVHAREMLENTA
jgi:hypothetical protein